MKTFNLKIIASDKLFYEGEAQILVFPAVDGEMAIEANHEAMAIAVTNGAMRFVCGDGTEVNAFTGTGFVHVLNDAVILLSHSVERAEDIDLVRAQEAKERAEERLSHKLGKIEYLHSQASLARAMARMAYRNKNH